MTLAAAVLFAALPVFAASPKVPKTRYIQPGSRGVFHVRAPGMVLEGPEWFVVVSSRALSWRSERVFAVVYRIADDAPPGPFSVTVKIRDPRRPSIQERRFDVGEPPLWGDSPLARSLARGIALFVAALLGHVVLWRRHPPKRHVPALLGAFGVPALIYAFFAPASGCLLWADLLAYASLAAAYMQSYPAAQAQSPTLLVAEALGRAPLGMTTEEIAAAIPPKKLVGDRVKDLLDAGLVEPGDEPDRVRLTGRGAALLPPFKALRMILGLPEGRG